MNHRLLVVDDNRAIHDDFRKVLAGPKRDGFDKAEAAFFGETPPTDAMQPEFEVDYASQGLEAIELFRRAHQSGAPHAVAFVDVRMPPGIGGLETAARLWEINPELQIVICSAHTDYSWEEMVLRLGHRDRLLILKKPFAGIEVLQLACALTEKWELAQQASHHLEHVEQEVAARTSALVAANQQLAAEIEQRKATEEQLLRSQRLESIGTLASGIAHDLNNLLSPIMMSSELLEDETLRPDQQALLGMIQISADRAAKIVAQMLTFARGTADERTVLEAGQLVDEIAKMAGQTFPSNIAIRHQAAPDLPLLLGNSTQLHQVLMNLCVNARDAMPAGGSILLAAENFTVDESYASGHPDARPGEYVLLRVSDTGTGIPEEILSKIFEPFFSTKEPGKGTGLGLSTAAGIVRNHGGFLEVKSVPSQGTTFLVYLPAALEKETCPARPAMLELPRGHGELILVVDDESAICEATAATLIRHGYQAITARDGAEGITAYAQDGRKVHAVLTDVNMPIVDGTAFARVLKNITPDVPILFMTGSVNEARLKEFHALGVYGVLAKPYHSEQLLSLLHQTLLPGSLCESPMALPGLN